MRLSRWARAALLVGILLLGLGVGPLWLSTILLPVAPPLIFVMAFYLLAPLGTAITALGLVLYGIALIRR